MISPFSSRTLWKILIPTLTLAILATAFFFVLLVLREDPTANLQPEVPPPFGQMYEVAEQQLHIHVQGEGGPTIIIEGAEGSWSAEWQHISEQLAEHVQVVTYDRAGYGYSSAPLTRREATQIAQELKSLLEQAQVEGPYFLVGHSFGAAYMHQFAQAYTEEVEGLFFIEPRGIDHLPFLHYSAFDPFFQTNQEGLLERILAKLGRTEELELDLWKQDYPEKLVEWTESVHVREKLAEALAMEKSGLEQGGDWGEDSFYDKNVPFTIMTTTSVPSYFLPEQIEEQERRSLDRLWQESQERYLSLSAEGQLITVENRTGYLLFEHADAIVEAILDQLQDIASRNRVEALVDQLLDSLFEHELEQFLSFTQEETSLYLFGTSFGEKLEKVEEKELTKMADFFQIYSISEQEIDVHIDYDPQGSSVRIDAQVDDMPGMSFLFWLQQKEELWLIDRMEAHSIYGISIASSETSTGYVDATNVHQVKTDTGLLKLRGYVGPDIQFVYVGVENGDRHKLVEIPTMENKKIERDIYLAGEVGEYVIAIVESKLESRNWDEIEMYGYYIVHSSYQAEEKYLRATNNVESNHPDIIQLAEQITSGISTDLQKAKAINDWISRHIQYDEDVILRDKRRSDTALETLHYRIVDCEGYSRLYAALLRSIGIPTRIIVGHANNIPSVDGVDNHVWNEVWIDGEWITVDPTWSAGFFDLGTGRYVVHPNQDFFHPTEEKFAQTHTRSAELLD